MKYILKRIAWLPFYFYYMLRLWKRILYGDISYYRCEPDGTSFLSALTAFKVAWIVWMT